LLGNKNEPDRLTLLVLKRDSLHTCHRRKFFSFAKAAEGNSEIITDIETFTLAASKTDACRPDFDDCPAHRFHYPSGSVAEEKEKTAPGTSPDAHTRGLNG
jgi:hypothetical protein